MTLATLNSFRATKLMMRQTIGVFLAAAFLLWTGIADSIASAGILVDNLNQPTRGTTSIDAGLWAAQGFATDAASYTLTDIRAFVGDGMGSPAVVAELRKSTLAGQIDTSAGGLLTTFTVPDVSAALAAQTFTPQLSISLDALTTYYFILGVSGPGSFGWSYAEGNIATGSGSLQNFYYSSDQGASWANYGSDNPYKMAVDVQPQAVPEPSTLAALAGVAVVFGSSFLIRRKWALERTQP